MQRAGGLLAALGARAAAAAAPLRSSVGGSAAGSSVQQARAGSTSVHPNKHVEQWLSRREDIDTEFRWTSRTVAHVLLFGLALPAALYNAIVWQAHKDDEYAGRPKRDFLWGHAERGELREP